MYIKIGDELVRAFIDTEATFQSVLNREAFGVKKKKSNVWGN